MHPHTNVHANVCLWLLCSLHACIYWQIILNKKCFFLFGFFLFGIIVGNEIVNKTRRNHVWSSKNYYPFPHLSPRPCGILAFTCSCILYFLSSNLIIFTAQLQGSLDSLHVLILICGSNSCCIHGLILFGHNIGFF